MGEGMTQEEEKRIDDKFESLKQLFTQMINNLNEKIDNFTKANEIKTNNQQAHISLVHATANENKMDIIKLEGRVNTLEKVEDLKDKMGKIMLNGEVKKMNAVKEAEECTKEKGMKKWQFWLVISISTFFSLSSLIITIYKLFNP